MPHGKASFEATETPPIDNETKSSTETWKEVGAAIPDTVKNASNSATAKREGTADTRLKKTLV
ncbi:MAG: hypothetical protein JNL84_00960 [Candidatus Accumulibacter sp.]|nr:hypothetical protein [Accumulibacter sp.]